MGLVDDNIKQMSLVGQRVQNEEKNLDVQDEEKAWKDDTARLQDKWLDIDGGRQRYVTQWAVEYRRGGYGCMKKLNATTFVTTTYPNQSSSKRHTTSLSDDTVDQNSAIAWNVIQADDLVEYMTIKYVRHLFCKSNLADSKL